MAVQPPQRTALRNREEDATNGSMTTTATSSEPSTRTPAPLTSGTLRLRAVDTNARHIQWAEDVIDNEGMGKKSSKVCCIYHAPHAVGESSDEDSSSSDESDSDSEPDNSTARRVGGGSGRGRRNHRHNHNHNHDHDHDHAHSPGGGEGQGKGKAKARAPSPNAYEKMPKYKPKAQT